MATPKDTDQRFINCAAAIRIVRAVRNISQKEMAVRAGIDPSYISLLEKGTRTPSMKTLHKISLALGVSTYLLILLSYDHSHLQELSGDEVSFIGRQIIEILKEV